MPELRSPTSTEIPGPWLIESSRLAALDGLYDGFLPRLREYRESQIQREIERRVERNFGVRPISGERAASIRALVERGVRGNPRFAGEERQVTVYLSRGRALRTELFSEARTHAGSANETPLGFRSELTVGEIEVLVSVSRSYSNSLEISVRPQSERLSQEVYGALLNWVDDFRPPT